MKSLIQDSSLTSLSALWVTLCTGLVWKHPELLLVFVSFTTCFAIAFVLGHPQNKVRVQIGIMACVLALLSLYHFRVPPPEYLALSILVGFLAFDHWYSAMYCTKPLAVAVEDALTLTLQLTLLVLVLSSDQQAWWSSYRSFLLTWTVYKITRLTWQVDQVPSSGDTKKRGVPATTNGTSNEFTKTQITSSKEPFFSHSDRLWTIRGEQYDLNEYISLHPGGKEAILLGRGRDCTALFESYHPFTQQHETVLQKYRIHKTDTDVSSKDPFYSILCQRVQESLKEQNFHPRNDRAASWLRCFYYAIIVTGVLLSARAHFKGSIWGSFFLAVFGWLVGALGHDAGHYSASRSAWMNDWGVWAMSFLCNPIMWQHQHTYAHHSHTNSFEHDPDLHHFVTFLRVHRRFQHNDVYKYQSNVPYVIFAYCFVCFGTCFWVPMSVIQEGGIYGMVEWTDRKRPLRALGMWAHLLVYVGFLMVWPFFVHSTLLKGLCAVVAHVATCGLLFALFSQINHLNEASLERKQQHDNPLLKNSWAVAQIETSNNFCPQSSFWHVLSNGLNLQIEHHLFPGLNHCHLYRIQPIVQATCREFGVEYKSYPSWSELMNATLQWLDKLAKAPSSH
ncbi:acyl-lipid (8-3)-desaturase [Fistulifera solaris]|uniref:Acyl-lipid (8-3)-desaturase n=1 Tax=Fistulifera solaris TaxID=1519565 RepID=A0A1Z5JR29_FISSO|nr:acyl-lipid (8-3)-desaturase [Fistulifera solaris]|eukprot:GAX16474.1 acyl-lipid (8-3)-desaturase [Fistulifera solaris]